MPSTTSLSVMLVAPPPSATSAASVGEPGVTTTTIGRRERRLRIPASSA
jgi:hypothetical protein